MVRFKDGLPPKLYVAVDQITGDIHAFIRKRDRAAWLKKLSSKGPIPFVSGQYWLDENDLYESRHGKKK